jgi:hypothetical protein
VENVRGRQECGEGTGPYPGRFPPGYRDPRIERFLDADLGELIGEYLFPLARYCDIREWETGQLTLAGLISYVTSIDVLLSNDPDTEEM